MAFKVTAVSDEMLVDGDTSVRSDYKETYPHAIYITVNTLFSVGKQLC